MPDFSQIQQRLAAIEAQNLGGGVVSVGFGSGSYNGFPSVLNDRLVTAMMGSGFDYEFTVVIPLSNLDGSTGQPAWTPAIDDVVTIKTINYRIAKLGNCQAVETIIHLGKYL